MTAPKVQISRILYVYVVLLKRPMRKYFHSGLFSTTPLGVLIKLAGLYFPQAGQGFVE